MPKSVPSDFAALYRETVTPLRRYLWRLLGCRSEAQDVAHDAYLKVYRVMDARALEQPAPFLYTTARRLALNRLRRLRKGTVQNAGGNVIEMAPSGGPSVEAMVAARHDWAKVETIIEGLPKGCRQVLKLSKVEHLTHREISERLGIAVSTVEKQHARALRLIQDALDELRAEMVDEEGGRACGR